MNVITPAPITRLITIVHVKCGGCGIDFGMERAYYDKRREDQQTFHCPNGCIRHFIGETEAERLRKQLAQTEACLTYARQDTERQRTLKVQTERRLRGTKAVVTRMKRRVTAGRCVCCSHKFKDLEKHMKAEHPKFDPDRGAEIIAFKPEASTDG